MPFNFCKSGGELLKHEVIFYCAFDAFIATRLAEEELFIAEVGFDINNFRLPLKKSVN